MREALTSVAAAVDADSAVDRLRMRTCCSSLRVRLCVYLCVCACVCVAFSPRQQLPILLCRSLSAKSQLLRRRRSQSQSASPSMFVFNSVWWLWLTSTGVWIFCMRASLQTCATRSTTTTRSLAPLWNRLLRLLRHRHLVFAFACLPACACLPSCVLFVVSVRPSVSASIVRRT